MNTRAFFRSPIKEIAKFAAVKLVRRKSTRPSEQYSYGADPVRDGVSTGKEKERKRCSVTPKFRRSARPVLLCHCARPYPAVKLAIKYKPRPKIAEGLFLALSMRGWMRGSGDAYVSAEKAERHALSQVRLYSTSGMRAGILGPADTEQTTPGGQP